MTHGLAYTWLACGSGSVSSTAHILEPGAGIAPCPQKLLPRPHDELQALEQEHQPAGQWPRYPRPKQMPLPQGSRSGIRGKHFLNATQIITWIDSRRPQLAIEPGRTAVAGSRVLHRYGIHDVQRLVTFEQCPPRPVDAPDAPGPPECVHEAFQGHVGKTRRHGLD